MPREKFAQRRATTTLEIPHRYPGSDARSFCISYSRLPSGRIGEIWVNSVNGYEKLVNDDVRDACIALSRGLQHGDSLEQISKSVLRDARGKPHGYLGSIVDALKREPMDA